MLDVIEAWADAFVARVKAAAKRWTSI